MTYRTDNKIRKYVKGYGFISFAKNLGPKHGKKIIDKGISASQSKYGKIFKKQGSEFGRIAVKKIIKKYAEATGDLIGSKITGKITSGKKDEKPQEPQEIITPPDKRQQILNDSTQDCLSWYNVKRDIIKLLIYWVN